MAIGFQGGDLPHTTILSSLVVAGATACVWSFW